MAPAVGLQEAAAGGPRLQPLGRRESLPCSLAIKDLGPPAAPGPGLSGRPALSWSLRVHVK